MKTKILRSTIFLLGIGVFLLLGSCQNQDSDNKLSTSEREEGWELLFDGETLNGWHAYGDTSNHPWRVEDGTLTTPGEGTESKGDIITDDQYENFILTCDWKISKGANSGIFYNVVESPMYETVLETGPEYQIIDDIYFPEMEDYELKDWQKLGAHYAMHAPDEDKKIVKEPGKWNSSKIVFDNGHVEYWLNGEKINEWEAWTDEWFARKGKPDEKGTLQAIFAGYGDYRTTDWGLARSGHIGLQDHGYQVSFKNIKLKELPRKPEEEVLFNGKDLTGWNVHGTEKWYVEDGLLVCESGPDEEYGYLSTREFYNNFELELEFLQESDGNSGVFFRSVFEGTKVHGWQVEVAPPGHDTGGIYESYGRGWLEKIPESREDILNMGEWNKMKIRVEGDRVTTWLNGQQMVDLEDEKIGEGQGRIALQIHSGGGIKVKWRDLKLKEL